MFCDDISAIVVHIGHLRSYIGFVGDELPIYQTDSHFYHDKNIPNSFFLIDEFSPQMNLEEGIIQSILCNKRINAVNNHTFFISKLASKINIDLQDVGVFLTTNLVDQYQEDRKLIMADLFESRQCPALFFCSKNLTSIFASGKSTGIVVDSGAYSTEITSIYQGHVLKKSRLISN